MYVRNIDHGPRGVNTPGGRVYLAPGEGRNVELVAAEEAAARATGWFAFAETGAVFEDTAPKARKRRKPTGLTD